MGEKQNGKDILSKRCADCAILKVKKWVDFMSSRMSLARMRAGQKGNIVRISGGYGVVRKLEALGIREGEKIKKISQQWMRGPVLLQHGNSQVALGFGMASKVLVEITEEKQR